MHIGQIDSGEEIGRTNLSNDEVTQGTLLPQNDGVLQYRSEAQSRHTVYAELRRDWLYMPVFWNCHDFVIRLAHIIVQPSMAVIRALRSLMLSLQQAYNQEIKWYETACNVCLGGWGVAATGAVAAVPPLAVAGACVFTAGWCVGFFGGFVLFSKSRKDVHS